jgi:hypothetical protein
MQTSLPIINVRHSDFTNDDSDRRNSVHNSSNGIVGMAYAVVLSSIFWILLGSIGYTIHLMLGHNCR